LEALVLSVLRVSDEPVTAGWVRGRLGGDLAYTTVITILTRLLAKGIMVRERVGRSFVWTPVSDQAGLAARRMRRVLDAESDREAVLASFVTGLGPDDERLLRELLRRARGEGEG
ncbi:MAG: BlaI/MecI/CopY family transcriptional regulator, partial [Streptomyces sp.]|nr:BlaI/MecI/CopY family transcriptional regulator [Streptomyces sp.]